MKKTMITIRTRVGGPGGVDRHHDLLNEDELIIIEDDESKK